MKIICLLVLLGLIYYIYKNSTITVTNTYTCTPIPNLESKSSCNFSINDQPNPRNNDSILSRLDNYGFYMPNKLTNADAQCIVNPQGDKICEENLYEKWYAFETTKVGHPSRTMYVMESPNPIFKYSRKYSWQDPSNSRRYY